MLAKIAWIKAIRFDCNECLCHKFLVISKCFHRSFLSSCIAIECKDYFATECIGIHQQATNNTNMVISKSCSAGCHCSGNSCKVTSHHIGVTFNDNYLTTLGNIFLRHIEPIEHLRLLVDRSFRSIEIFRPLIFFITCQFTCTESDNVSRDIFNRPHHAIAELINRPAFAHLG